jgi:8-oxo-dGTP pyrophosphatase MutT (NUDIX family)
MAFFSDGDGWTTCDAGHQHWGRHGAAGLLLRSVDAEGNDQVLLQRRAWWTHHGNTWGIPGGAKGSSESAEEAALRELSEEVEMALEGTDIIRVHHDDHGGWSYWTVIATVSLPIVANARSRETAEVRWVRCDAVSQLELHPGFAATWPLLADG